jgi:uncharacterized protein (DUF2345 family)
MLEKNGITAMTMGIVRDNQDPDQMGRLKIYIPAVDNHTMTVEDLPWAIYVTPFGGVNENFLVGREKDPVPGFKAYGMWNVPKIGAHVLVTFMDGDPNFRIYLGCFWPTFMNFTLPGGKNSDNGKNGTGFPKTNDNQVIEPFKKNLKEAGLEKKWIDRTRGGWQRNVNVDLPTDRAIGTEGYHPNVNDPSQVDSQVFSWTSPGGHYIVMDDSDTDCRIRLKTTAGHQILLDDSNERIYISTAKGKNWIEIDEDGHIHIYAEKEISIRAEQSINIKSDKTINLDAKIDVNLRAGRDINLEAHRRIYEHAVTDEYRMECKSGAHLAIDNGPLNVTAKDLVSVVSKSSGVNIQTQSAINLKAGSGLNIQGSGEVNIKSSSKLNIQSSQEINIKSAANLSIQGGAVVSLKANVLLQISAPKITNFSGSNAGSAGSADSASVAATIKTLVLDLIIPAHEPWDRPTPEFCQDYHEALHNHKPEKRNKNWKK